MEDEEIKGLIKIIAELRKENKFLKMGIEILTERLRKKDNEMKAVPAWPPMTILPNDDEY